VAKKILKINTKTKRAHNLRGAAATATGHSRAIICLRLQGLILYTLGERERERGREREREKKFQYEQLIK